MNTRYYVGKLLGFVQKYGICPKKGHYFPYTQSNPIIINDQKLYVKLKRSFELLMRSFQISIVRKLMIKKNSNIFY
jgi:hypothetical protein